MLYYPSTRSLFSIVSLVLSIPVVNLVAAANHQNQHTKANHKLTHTGNSNSAAATERVSAGGSLRNTAASDSEFRIGYGAMMKPCCFRIGYGAMMKPCCYKEVPCSEYDQYLKAKKEKSDGGEHRTMVGGGIGKSEEGCPADAEAASVVIKKLEAADGGSGSAATLLAANLKGVPAFTEQKVTDSNSENSETTSKVSATAARHTWVIVLALGAMGLTLCACEMIRRAWKGRPNRGSANMGQNLLVGQE